MRITEQALGIKELIAVTKGASPISHTVCESRKYDAFVYIFSGSAEYTFHNRAPAVAQTGDVMFLAKGSRYRMDIWEEGYTYLFVDFLFDGAPSLENEIFHSRLFEKTAHLFTRAHRLFHIGTTEDFLYCESAVYNIYADIVKSEHEKYLPRKARSVLAQAVDTVAEKYGDRSLTVASLARTAGMSEVYFRRLFKAQYGASPAAFISAYRVSVAKRLLAATTLSVSAIAAECGFDTPYYFARVFKAHTAATPLAYRRANRENG